MQQFVLVHPATPPSFNKVGHSGSRWTWTKTKKEWQGTFEMLFLLARLPKLMVVEARAELVFPTARRRDEGNYRTLLEKVVGDALVGDKRVWPEGRWLPDDDPEHYIFGRVTFNKGSACTRLFLDAEVSP